MTSRAKLKETTFTLDGKRYHVYGHTITEAKEKARIKKALLTAGIRQAKGEHTVASWANTWLESYKADTVNPAWYKTMQGVVDSIITPCIGHTKIKNIRPVDITRVLNSMAGKSESYTHKVYIILKQIFATAYDNDLILKDPTKPVKLPICGKKTERRTITPYERELTLRASNNHPEDGLFFLLMLYCGLRPQEVAVLRYCDIEPDRQILHVTRSLKSDNTIGEPKSQAGVRDIPMPSILVDFIARLHFKPSDYLCTNTRGERLSHTSIRTLWHRFKREMELEHGTKVKRNALVDPFLPSDLTPYCYRHTYCTDLQDAGVPLVVASRLMGHSDVKLTARVYTHASQDSFNDALSRIDARFKGATGGTT